MKCPLSAPAKFKMANVCLYVIENAKLDKAPILKDAVEYINQLQEHLKALEEASKQLGKPTHPKKIRMAEDINESHCQSSALISDIKARVCDREILISIHCKKPEQVTLKLLGELEKLHLTVINCSVIPFDESHNITIIAQEYGLAHKTVIFVLDEFDLFAQDADQLLEKRVRSRFSHRKLLFLPPSKEDLQGFLQRLLEIYLVH